MTNALPPKVTHLGMPVFSNLKSWIRVAMAAPIDPDPALLLYWGLTSTLRIMSVEPHPLAHLAETVRTIKSENTRTIL